MAQGQQVMSCLVSFFMVERELVGVLYTLGTGLVRSHLACVKSNVDPKRDQE